MSWLVDTNIISEVRKGARCDPRVAAWYAGIDGADLYLSSLVLGEIRKGIELARPRDPSKAAALEKWLQDVRRAFDGRILPIDTAAAEEWGRMSAIRPLPVVDSLLAATAKAGGLTLVTRNDRDISDLGASILNPFA